MNLLNLCNRDSLGVLRVTILSRAYNTSYTVSALLSAMLRSIRACSKASTPLSYTKAVMSPISVKGNVVKYVKRARRVVH